jgi:hypothetical protein
MLTPYTTTKDERQKTKDDGPSGLAFHAARFILHPSSGAFPERSRRVLRLWSFVRALAIVMRPVGGVKALLTSSVDLRVSRRAPAVKSSFTDSTYSSGFQSLKFTQL